MNAMFPPHASATNATLSVDEFYAIFDECWSEMQHRFFKFERLQEYYEPDNPSYRSFAAGDFEGSLKQLSDAVNQGYDLFSDASNREILTVRVHAVVQPLSDYLRWELKSYQLTAKYGERILIADFSNEPSNSDIYLAQDFILFDDKAVLIHDYTETGELIGGWLIRDPGQIKRYLTLSKKLIASAVPLGAFERVAHLE